jgi:hypothetical protein
MPPRHLLLAAYRPQAQATNRARPARRFVVERVTRIELALSAWESERTDVSTWVKVSDLLGRMSVSDRGVPVIATANGTLMARFTASSGVQAGAACGSM